MQNIRGSDLPGAPYHARTQVLTNIRLVSGKTQGEHKILLFTELESLLEYEIVDALKWVIYTGM